MTRAADIRPPQAGDVLVLTEDDYRYGRGPVLARVTMIIDRVQYQGEPWWHTEAQVADGTPENHGGWQPRGLYVREAALPISLHHIPGETTVARATRPPTTSSQP